MKNLFLKFILLILSFLFLTSCHLPLFQPVIIKALIAKITGCNPLIINTWQGYCYPPPIIYGTGQKGLEDGVFNKAKFGSIEGMVVDGKGNLFVADTENYRIRKITSDGIVSTFAGSNDGYIDGKVLDAKFNYLEDIAIDSKDNLYVSDKNKVRKITIDGNVTTFFESQKNDYIHILKIDKDDNLYMISGLFTYKISLKNTDKLSTLPEKYFNKYLNILDSKSNSYRLDVRDNRGYLAWSITMLYPPDYKDEHEKEIMHDDLDTLSYEPTTIALDSKDNLYLAITFNYNHNLSNIIKITPWGFKSIIYSVYLGYIRVLTIDEKNNVLYVDGYNQIYKISL